MVLEPPLPRVRITQVNGNFCYESQLEAFFHAFTSFMIYSFTHIFILHLSLLSNVLFT